MKLKIKFNVKPFLNYLLVILLTALGISTILVALPLTEKISGNTPFNLVTKDSSYWSKEYTLKLETSDSKNIEKSRDIISKRLRKFEVEKFSIRKEESGEENITILKVIVNTTKNQELVKELIGNRFDVLIVTRKADVDFFSEEDQYAYLFAKNYDPTDWDRSDFRNVYINELKTADNKYSNFAIFKLWANKQKDFTEFLVSQKGEYIGVSIDGFVTPYLVPLDDQSIFAVPITSEDETQIQAINILYNSGVIPVNFTVDSELEIDPQIIKIDYVKITIGLAISLLLTYVYLLLLKQTNLETLKKSFLATVLTISIYLAILKLIQIPIDTFLLPILAILTFILIKVLAENSDSVIYIEIGLVIILVLIKVLGFGYMTILSSNLIVLIILSKMCLILSAWYINKVREI